MSDTLDYSDPWDEPAKLTPFPPRFTIPDDVFAHADTDAKDQSFNKAVSNNLALYLPRTWGGIQQ